MPSQPQIDNAQRSIVLVVAALVGPLMWPSLLNVFQLPKVTLIVLAAVTILLLSAYGALLSGQVALPRSPVLWAVISVLLLGMLLSTLFAPVPWVALVGEYQRHTGLAAYVAYATLFVYVLMLFPGPDGAGQVARGLLVGGGVVCAYAVLQVLGADPIAWNSFGRSSNEVSSTLGNPNFLSAYVGLLVPLAIWGAATRTHSVFWRALSSFVLVAGVVVLWAAASVQGIVVAAVGGSVVVFGWATRRFGIATRVRWMALGAATGLVALTGILLRPTLVEGLGLSLTERLYIYQAALKAFADQPIVGVGLSMFGNAFGQYRSIDHAVRFGSYTTDTAHSVPLDLLSTGGVLVGAAYFAFVLYVGWVALRGVVGHDRKESDSTSFLLMALAGAWFGYQAQALISIDLPPLAVTHWLLAAAIVAIGAPPKTVTHRFSFRVRRRYAGWLGVGVVLIGLLVAWAGTRPIRADLAAGRAAAAAQAGQLGDALAHLDRAAALAPWESIYRLRRAALLESAGEIELALRADEEAAELEPGQSLYAHFSAQLAEILEETETARRWYVEALDRDPLNPEILLDYAEFLVTSDEDADAALEITQRPAVVRAIYGQAKRAYVVGRAHELKGELAAAREAYAEALRIDGSLYAARDALAALVSDDAG